jgi:hypothetical protein
MKKPCKKSECLICGKEVDCNWWHQVKDIFWRVNEVKRIFEIKKPKKTKDDIWVAF